MQLKEREAQIITLKSQIATINAKEKSVDMSEEQSSETNDSSGSKEKVFYLYATYNKLNI